MPLVLDNGRHVLHAPRKPASARLPRARAPQALPQLRELAGSEKVERAELAAVVYGAPRSARTASARAYSQRKEAPKEDSFQPELLSYWPAAEGGSWRLPDESQAKRSPYERRGQRVSGKLPPSASKTTPVTPATPATPATAATSFGMGTVGGFDVRTHTAGENGLQPLNLGMGLSATSWVSFDALQDEVRAAPPPGGAKGLWALSPPVLPPSTFAAKVYSRKQREEPALDLSNMLRPKPEAPPPPPPPPPLPPPEALQKTHIMGYTKLMKDKEISAMQATTPTTCQSCGNVYMKDSLFCRQCGARRQAAKDALQVEADEHARQLQSQMQKSISAHSLKGTPMTANMHKSLYESTRQVPQERSVVIGDTKIKLSSSGSRKTVLAELDCGEDDGISGDQKSPRRQLSPKTPSGRQASNPKSSAQQVSSTDLATSVSLAAEAEANLSPEDFSRHDGFQTLHTASNFPSSGSPGRKIVSGMEDQAQLEGAGKAEGATTCSHCGNVFLRDSVFCRSCGQKREQARGKQSPAGGDSSRGAVEAKDAKSEEIPEELWVNVFKKLQEHNEVHQDDLPRALELCGFVFPCKEWVKQIYDTITEYSTIEMEEFFRLVQAYQELQDEAYHEAFQRADDDGSGYVEAGELAVLLRGFGIEPMSHVLEEVLHEVDEDGRGELDLEEFKHMMDLILQREGFTKSEYEEFMSIYGRFDRDGSGEIDTKELIAILNWLGYATDPTELLSIISQVDVDGSGEINEREFLMCMRKVRERELQLVVDTMNAADADGSGTVSKDEVKDVLKALGYDQADPAAIDEAAREAKLESDELDLGQLWRLLLLYRNREGMCNKDVQEINKAFDMQDKDGSGELTALEAPGALRDLGYKAGFEVMQSVLSKVDVDDTGALDQVEFRKMVRMLEERDVVLFKEAFMEKDEDDRKVLKESECKEVMLSLGLRPLGRAPFQPEELIVEDGKEARVSIDNFVRACQREARHLRETFKQNGGWTDPEVADFLITFNKYDVKGQGQIANKELVRLVEDLIPEMASDRSMRPQLLALMREVDQDASGSLKFNEFLKLMQLFLEFQDKEKLQKEQTAIKETGFAAQEVTEFRELFLQNDGGGGGDLSFKEFRAMIHQITPLGDALTAELEEMFREVTIRKNPQSSGKQEADFPEFLFLMKTLLDRNFAGIKEKTSSHGQK